MSVVWIILYIFGASFGALAFRNCIGGFRPRNRLTFALWYWSVVLLGIAATPFMFLIIAVIAKTKRTPRRKDEMLHAWFPPVIYKREP